jgi:hypothetical protein
MTADKSFVNQLPSFPVTRDPGTLGTLQCCYSSNVCQKRLVKLTEQENAKDVNASASLCNPPGTVKGWRPPIVETLGRNDLDSEIRHQGLHR